jgi:hypothetical protein
VNIGIAIALFVFGGVFFTLAGRGDVFTGLVAGALIGVVSGLMGLGILSSLIKKDDINSGVNLNTRKEPSPISDSERNNNLSIGFFRFPSTADIPPSHYGYWSLRWSDDLAGKSLIELSSGSLDGCSKYMDTYLTRLQLLALYTASYWAYAVYILGVPSECVDEMKKGMNDSIKEYRDPEGGKISDQFIDTYQSFFKRSLKAISDDINNPAEQGAFNPDISNVAKSFNEAIEYYNFRDGAIMPEVEKTYIGMIVANIPLSLFEALKSQDLKYIG